MKTILITGSTDGIGLQAAHRLLTEGHDVLVHGRNEGKLQRVRETLSDAVGRPVHGIVADLSDMSDVESLAAGVQAHTPTLDVLLNNAGVLRAPEVITPSGLDLRFVVNTVAPYLLTKRLLGHLPATGRVVNVSSAAQAPVTTDALSGRTRLDDFAAYSQSKLALMMWTAHLARTTAGQGPSFFSLNPGSMLGTKMVQEGFGVAGGDVGIGADILSRAAVSKEFEDASGRYFDNDARQFGPGHPDASNEQACEAVAKAVEALLDRLGANDASG